MANPFDSMPTTNPFDAMPTTTPTPTATPSMKGTPDKALLSTPISGAHFGLPLTYDPKLAQHFQQIRDMAANRFGPILSPVEKGFGVVDRLRQAAQNALTTPNQKVSPWTIPGYTFTDPVSQRIGQGLAGDVTPQQDTANQNQIMATLGKAHLPDNPFTRFLMNTGTDLTMYLGDLPASVMRGTEAHALAKTMQGLAYLDRVNPQLAGRARKFFDTLHDLTGVDSATKRKLASGFASQWVNEYAAMSGTRAMAKSSANEFTRQFGQRFTETLKGVDPTSEAMIYDAIDKGTVDALPDVIKPQAQALEKLTDDLFYLEADAPTRQDMLSNGYTGLDDWAKKLDTGPAKNPATISSYRGKYVPGARQLAQGAQPTRRISEITRQDPFLLPREDPIPQSAFDPGATQYFRDAFMRRFHAAGRNVASGAAERKLLGQFGGQSFEQLPEYVKEFYQKTLVGDQGFNPLGTVADWGKSAIDLQKGSIFYLPFRHMGNIGFLSILHDIGATPSLIKEYAKTAAMSPEKRFEYFAPEIARGAVQIGDAGDRASAFTQVLKRIGTPSRSEPTLWSTVLSNTLRTPFRLAGQWYSLVGDQLWKFDDAAKAVSYRRNLARNLAQRMAPEDAANMAAYETNASLVDYSTRSELANALAYVTPFSTWHTKAPMAVARGVIKNPGIAAAMYRASPASFGGEPQVGGGKVERSSLPGAEFAKAVTDPLAYAEAGVGLPRVLGNEIVNAATRGRDPYPFTYGKSNVDYLKSQIPFIGPAQQFTGQGLFPQTPEQALLQNTTGFYQANQTPQKGSLAQRFVDNYMKTHPGASIGDAWRAYGAIGGL